MTAEAVAEGAPPILWMGTVLRVRRPPIVTVSAP